MTTRLYFQQDISICSKIYKLSYALGRRRVNEDGSGRIGLASDMIDSGHLTTTWLTSRAVDVELRLNSDTAHWFTEYANRKCVEAPSSAEVERISALAG